MAATTVKKIIKKAMQKGGILTKTQLPAADEYADALDNLNDMLESWSNDSMMLVARIKETFSLTGAVNGYTIGTGQTFNTTKPIDIVAATISFGGMDYPLAVIDDEKFQQQIMLKTQAGIPEFLNFNNAYPTSLIRLWPVDSGVSSITLLSEKTISTFALNDSVDLAPGWNRTLIYNLACEICGDYGVDVPEKAQQIAIESKSLIQKAVMKNRSLDATPQNMNVNNIYTGWNR